MYSNVQLRPPSTSISQAERVSNPPPLTRQLPIRAKHHHELGFKATFQIRNSLAKNDRFPNSKVKALSTAFPVVAAVASVMQWACDLRSGAAVKLEGGRERKEAGTDMFARLIDAKKVICRDV